MAAYEFIEPFELGLAAAANGPAVRNSRMAADDLDEIAMDGNLITGNGGGVPATASCERVARFSTAGRYRG